MCYFQYDVTDISHVPFIDVTQCNVISHMSITLYHKAVDMSINNKDIVLLAGLEECLG